MSTVPFAMAVSTAATTSSVSWAGNAVGRDVRVRAGGVAHRVGVADEGRLERRGAGDLGGGVEPRAVGVGDVADDGAGELRQHLDLAGRRVGQLGALPQLGVVDRQSDAGGGVEDRLDQRRVRLEHVLR